MNRVAESGPVAAGIRLQATGTLVTTTAILPQETIDWEGMKMSDHPSPLFFSGCTAAIQELRKLGMNEMIIGCVLSEVRAAAIAEERQRVDELRSKNPPEHFPAQNFAQYLERWMPQ